MTELKKSLSIWRGTALFINIVLGAGVLVLPGLTVQIVGGLSFASWLICALLATPLFVILIILGCRHPGPGGIATFAQLAFGKLFYIIASLLFLGAVILGLPAISLTGGYYASSTLGGSAHLNALVILLASLFLNIQSVQLAGGLNQWLSWLLVVFLIGLAFISFALVANEPIQHTILFPKSAEDFSKIWLVIPMIFFAFTGWEIGASITGEFKNPKDDLPIAMWASFFIATSLYLILAYVVQAADLNNDYVSPFSTIINTHYGYSGKLFIGATAAILIFANLCAASWGVSRMVYALAKEKMLPASFTNLINGQPRLALCSIITVFCAVVIIDWAGLIGINNLLTLAGQNFVFLYGICALSLFKLSQSNSDRVISVTGLLVCIAIVSFQGINIIYPAIIIAIATVLYYLNPAPSRAPDINQS